MKLKIHHKKKTEKQKPQMWRLNNMLLSNEGVSEDIEEETNILGIYTEGGGF